MLGIFTIEQKQETVKFSSDYSSLFAITLMFTGLIYGFSNFGEKSFFSLHVAGAFLVCVVGTILLIYFSKTQKSPLLHLNLLKNKSFLVHVISYFIIQLVLMGLVFILPNYIQIVLGENPQTSGLVVFPGAALGALMTPVGGKLLDKFGAKKPIVLGNVVMHISLSAFLFFIKGLSIFGIGLLYFVFTLGISLSFGNVMTNGLQGLLHDNQPDGNAIMMTFQQVAGAMGTSIVASIISLYQGKNSQLLSGGTVKGSKVGLLLLIILLAIEFILIARVLYQKQDNNTSETLE